MLCEKCGKMNKQGRENCSFCGAKMPGSYGGNGFFDILSIKKVSTEAAADRPTEDTALLNKKVLALQRRVRKLEKLVSVMIAALLVLAVALVIFAVIAISGKDAEPAESPTPTETVQPSYMPQSGGNETVISETVYPVATDEIMPTDTEKPDVSGETAPTGTDGPIVTDEIMQTVTEDPAASNEMTVNGTEIQKPIYNTMEETENAE